MICALLTAAVVFILSARIFPDREGTGAVITVNGAEYKTVDFTEQLIEIKNEYGVNIIAVDSGGIWMRDSDCDSRECVKTGRIESAGEVIACLPHHLVITVSGGGDTDAVSR